MKNKLIFIGNSIVNGFPLSRGRSFPGLVRAALKEGVDAGGKAPLYCDVINKGANGETTMDILGRFEHDVLDHEPRAVFILTGTNDFIYREADPAACLENLEKMARMAEDAGIVPVYMTPLLVDAEKAARQWMAGLGIDYDQINGEVEEFSGMIRESGRLYIDACEAFKTFAAGDEEAMASLPLQEENELPTSPGEAYQDGVHPTPQGYRFLAGVVLDWVTAHAAELGLQ